MSVAMERGALLSAAPSPRIVGGVLKWYEGDTFELQVELDLTDENGGRITIESGQTVEFVFRDHTHREVYHLCFGEIEDNRVTLDFSEDVSALFPKGAYTYDVLYRGAVRRTLAHDAPIRVE